MTNYRNIANNGTNISTETDHQESDTTSEATASTNASTQSKSNTNIQNTEDYIETVKGKQGTENYSDLIMKFRKTFLNIDMQIIDDLQELFMGIW